MWNKTGEFIFRAVAEFFADRPLERARLIVDTPSSYSRFIDGNFRSCPHDHLVDLRND
jgi:hypothetical protein